MANEAPDAKLEGNTNVEAAKPTGPAVETQPPAPSDGNSPAATEVVAGPAPHVAFTPDASATGVIADQPQPAAVPDALIGSWLAEHIHYADVPYVVLVVVVAFLLGSFAANNTDIWQNLAAGRLLSEGKYSLGEDPFGTVILQEDPIWVNQNWLYSRVSYLFYREGGTLLVVLKALCAAGLAWILLLIRPNNRHRWAGTLCVLLGVLAVSPTGFQLHPMVISLLFIAGTLLVLHRAGVLAQTDGPARPKLLWALPPLFLVWVNIDSWFIFGPIILVCCLVGLLLDAGMGNKPHFDILQLSKVLGVCMLASLCNPFHYRAVLLLPLELSYLLVKMGNFWPEYMVAGGRALNMLKMFDLNYQPTMTPWDKAFWSMPAHGLNVAGISFYVLVVVVVGSFYLCSKASPGVLLVRAAPALFCAVLALLLVRLIPLFAVVGTVVLLLNLQEYLAWRETTDPARIEEQSLWANMTRLVMGFVFFALLFLAWPGWITQGIGDFVSPRRVAWNIVVDPSLKETAEYLKEKYANGDIKRSMNFQREIANFCAWHAPEMRFLIDQRLQLFDRQTQLYVALHESILNWLQNKDSTVRWRDEFARFGLDSMICPLNPGNNQTMVLFMASMNPMLDLQATYADGKTAVLILKNKARAPLKSLHEQWREMALAQQDAPWPTEIISPELQSFWDRYLSGQPQPSLAAKKSHLLSSYFNVTGTNWNRFWFAAPRAQAMWAVNMLTMPNNLSIGPLPILLNAWGGTVQLMPGKAADQEMARKFGLRLPMPGENVPETMDFPFMMQKVMADLGPADAPLLSMREARKAVAMDPEDPFGHRTLAMAVDFMKDLENYWNERQADHWGYLRDPRGMEYEIAVRQANEYEIAVRQANFQTLNLQQPFNLRGNLRNYQYIAALQRVARLKPTDAAVHWDLVSYFSNHNCPDMALEHMQLFSEYLDSSAPNADKKKQVEENKKRLKEYVEGLQNNLKVRVGDKASPLENASKAYFENVQITGTDGKPGPYRPLGLMQTAHKYLLDFIEAQGKLEEGRTKDGAKEAVLDKKEFDMKTAAFQMLFEVDLSMGNVWELKNLVEIHHLDKRPEFAWKMFYYYGVIGDYAKADKVLADLDEERLPFDVLSQAFAMRELFPRVLTIAAPGATLAGPLTAYPALYYPPIHVGVKTYALFPQFQEFLSYAQTSTKAERLTMRGILAMEAGKTKAALPLFRDALKLSGPSRYFIDRAIAERYKHLLEANR
jgi:hypothetical protein